MGGALFLKPVMSDPDREDGLSHLEASEGPHVLLSISDTGHGMDTETRGGFLNRFLRPGTSDRGPGWDWPWSTE